MSIYVRGRDLNKGLSPGQLEIFKGPGAKSSAVANQVKRKSA